VAVLGKETVPDKLKVRLNRTKGILGEVKKFVNTNIAKPL
jgi:hypothetical protein